jgi:hypothetical protein
MRRITVTLPDELEKQLEHFLQRQETPPSITKVMQVAMWEYLNTQALRQRGFVPAKKPFQITALAEIDQSGEADVSDKHDAYLNS